MSNSLSIPKGTRDFTPEQVAKREYIFQTLKNIFALYGFVPIETPSMENLSTLLGKYGDEGDKLLFKILNSGDFANDVSEQQWNERNSNKLSLAICEKGLRYDLTVPFARYVVMHRNEITFPFKRYQIQPVWRADRPQKGRYREFYQCDVDIIGTNSLLCEIELFLIIHDVFESLNLKYLTYFNNRKILQGLAIQSGFEKAFTPFAVILDKLDKIGLENVFTELNQLSSDTNKLNNLKDFLKNFLEKEDNQSRLNYTRQFITNDIGNEGIQEVEFLLSLSNQLKIHSNLSFNILLARGLSYYTGTILEVKSTETPMGSICGGGRYDNLTGIFGMPNVSGVGMSFGADRIYDIMETLGRFPEHIAQPIDVFIPNFLPNLEVYLLNIAAEFRKNKLRVELYPNSSDKLKKQLTIANQRKIPWVLIVGEDEIAKNTYTLKNMTNGEQFLLPLDDIIETILKAKK